MHRLKYFVAAVILFTYFLTALVIAENLDAQYKISLKDKDRVLGTLEDNFIVYGRPYIALYNNFGKKLWSKKLKNNVKPYFSDNGQYLLLATYTDRSPTDLKTMKLEMYAPDGSHRGSINKPAATNFHISNSGLIVGVEGVPGIPPTRLHIYEASGNRVAVLHFDDYHGLVFSPSGDKFIVDHNSNGLEIYDGSGLNLGKLPPADKFLFDKGGKHIGVFDRGYFILYEGEQEVNQVHFVENTLVDMAVDVDAGLLILMGERNLGLFDPLSGKPIKEFRLNEPEKTYTSLDLSDDSQSFVCGVDINQGKEIPKDSRHSEGYLYIYRDLGNNLVLHREQYNMWQVGLPRAVFSSRDGSVMLQTAEAVKKLQLPPR